MEKRTWSVESALRDLFSCLIAPPLPKPLPPLPLPVMHVAVLLAARTGELVKGPPPDGAGAPKDGGGGAPGAPRDDLAEPNAKGPPLVF